MPTIPQIDIKQYFCTNMVIPKELLAKNLVYLGMVCNVSLKNLRKLHKCGPKEVAGLKAISSRRSVP